MFKWHALISSSGMFSIVPTCAGHLTTHQGFEGSTAATASLLPPFATIFTDSVSSLRLRMCEVLKTRQYHTERISLVGNGTYPPTLHGRMHYVCAFDLHQSVCGGVEHACCALPLESVQMAPIDLDVINVNTACSCVAVSCRELFEGVFSSACWQQSCMGLLRLCHSRTLQHIGVP